MLDQPEMKATERLERAPLAAPQPATPRLKIRYRWFGVGAAILLLCVLAIWWGRGTTGSLDYVTLPADKGVVARTVTATGTVNPELTIIVGSYVSGVIQQLYCDYNTEVKAGQVCAKIDPRPYQMIVNQDKANLSVARAQFEKDKANLTYTKLNYARNRYLAGRQSVSQDTADLAKNAYDQAQAQLGLDSAAIEQRQAELDAAEINLGYTDIVSPVNGVVVSRNVTQGQTVAASFQTPTLFLIATDLTKMQVDTNVSESDVGGIKEGNDATFTVDAFPNRTFEGKVTQLRQSPQTVQNVVTFDAVVGVDNKDLALKPGMTAATRIIIDQRSGVLRVPNQALRYLPGGISAGKAEPTTASSEPLQPGQARLWVLRDGHPSAVPVVLGLSDDDFTEIVRGDVHPGDAVIIAEQNRRGASASPADPALKR